MGRLTGVEVRRLCARRLVRGLLLLIVGGLLVINGVQFAKSDRDTTAARAEAARQAAEWAGRTRTVPAVPGPDGQMMTPEAPGADDFYRDPRYRMRDQAPGNVKAAGILAALLAFVVGTSFGGAEWAAGTMQSLLFWEPRRLRVMAAKSVALGGLVVAASLAVQLLQVGLSALTAGLRGTMEGAGGGFYRELAGTSVRLALLAAFTALLAFAVAGLTRNTAAALGVAFAYVVVGEIILRGIRPFWSRWMLFTQVEAWIEKSASVPRAPRPALGEFFPTSYELHMGRAGITLAVYLAVALGAMALLFARRDVT